MLRGVDLDESKPVAEQLRAVLQKQSVKVISLFREWDDDASGSTTILIHYYYTPRLDY